MRRLTARGLANLVIRLYRYYRWHFHPGRLIPQTLAYIPIDRPIFLLGVQGGGLTLLARMLRRHPHAVSVTGDSEYWAGPDEMQNVMGSLLPQQLTGLHHKVPSHQKYKHRDSLYAIDDLLPLYRETRQNVAAEIAQRFAQAIRLAININAQNPRRARFVDKSQTFTVRLGLVNALLDECSPHFILVTRNPYASCYRDATRIKSHRILDIPMRERLQLAGQHWSNSFKCALSDADQVSNFLVQSFEELLRQPKETLLQLCSFLDLPFREEMLPTQYDTLPLGSTGSSEGDHKWYPIRPNVNRKYLNELEPWMVDVLRPYVGTLAEKWRYSPEGP